MYQKNRKDLTYDRAFMTVSTKHTAISYNSRKTILRTAPVCHVDRGSSTLLIRGLAFKTKPQFNEKTDVLSVQAVPSNFVSISKPSEAVERLMTKRKNSHENSLEAMRKELAAVHEECENEIRERSMRIKIQIDKIIANIEEAQRRIEETDLLRLTNRNLRSTWDSIKHFVTEKKRCIDEFHECLKNMEHNRCSRVKAVLQKYYEIFHSISYIVPFEIQTLLENEIQDYNKTVLMNFKVYENLHLNMNIQTDYWNKELENWLENMKERKRDAISSENFEQLIQKRKKLEQVEEIFLYDSVGQFALKELSSKLNEIERVIAEWESTIVIFDELSVNDCVKQLNDAVTELNISGIKLVESYKFALEKISDQYEQEVKSFKAINKNGFWEEDMERLDEAVRSLRDCYENVTRKLEDLWNEQSNAIQDSVKVILSFLQEFNSMWKQQSSRLIDLQETTSRFVDELTAKNEKSILELEKKAIAYSQQLRESTTEEKMKQQLTQMFSTLDLICEKYKLTYNEECKAIEKYIENVFNEVYKIIEQFNKFIGSYDQNIIKESEEESEAINLPDYDPGFIRQQLRMCRNLGPEIFYWMATLLKVIMAFRENFSEATRETAQEWQETVLAQRSYNLQTKLDADSQRREEIKISIYEVRVQEIESHSKRLDNYKEKVNQMLNVTSNRLNEFLEEQKQSLQKYQDDIVHASEQISAEKSTVGIQRLQKEIAKIREDYKIEVEQKTNVYKEELERIFETLSNNNDNYLNEIKIFKEGGNFSVEEAKSNRQSLTLFNKTISKSKITNMQKMDKAFDELSKAIEKNYKTIDERIKTTTRDLKYYEDAQKILTKCAVILERQVYRLFEDNTRFVNAVVNNIEESTKELCKNSNVDIYAVQSIRILDLMDSRLDNLIIGFPIAKSNSVNDQVKPNRKISKGNQQKRQKSIPKVTNYRNLFLGSDENSLCENCFSTTVMNTMLKTIDEIQTEAMAFFSPISKRRESEATYRDYMQQILHQLYCYREQLENLWRQEVQEVLAAAEAFERSSSGYILNSIINLHENHINEAISMKETKLKELKKAIKVYTARRNKMYDSLKVSYGHPERKDSLAKLTEEVMEEENEMEEVITNELTEYKTVLRDLVSFYETSLQDLAEPLRNVLTKLKDRGKRLEIKELLNKRNRSGLPEFTGISYRLDLPEKTNRSLIYRDNSESAKYNNFDIESVVNRLMENARELYTSVVEEWEIEVNSFYEGGDEFKENWRRNVEIVADVYKEIL